MKYLPGFSQAHKSTTACAQGLSISSRELPLENQGLASLPRVCFYSFLGEKNHPAHLEAQITPIRGPEKQIRLLLLSAKLLSPTGLCTDG